MSSYINATCYEESKHTLAKLRHSCYANELLSLDEIDPAKVQYTDWYNVNMTLHTLL